MQKITKQQLLTKGFLKVEEAEIEYRDKNKKLHKYTRERLIREEAVAVFIYNTETNRVILTKQFRFPIADKVEEPVLEIVAGKVSTGEDPMETALRESLEESGYKINKEKLKFIASVFASPGYTSERFYLYYAEVVNGNKVNEGGGLEDEHEFIEVVEMPMDNFMKLVDKGKIEDCKTLLTALWVKIHIKRKPNK